MSSHLSSVVNRLDSSDENRRSMNEPTRQTREDPLRWIDRIANKLRGIWVRWTFPFASLGRNFQVHHTCDLKRSIAPYIKVGHSVLLDRDVWINIPFAPESGEPAIIFEEGCVVGRRCVISAMNRIHCGKNVIFAPSVLVMDHNHAFEDVRVPIKDQGVTKGGMIRIEEGCWIGYGAAIVCGKGELVIGSNSVIGANAVVSRSIPPNSVVTGNPARVVKQFDPVKGEWVMGSSAYAKATAVRG
jgi:acetyltransferase-like isoleucine patch superfamily enzyme